MQIQLWCPLGEGSKYDLGYSLGGAAFESVLSQQVSGG